MTWTGCGSWRSTPAFPAITTARSDPSSSLGSPTCWPPRRARHAAGDARPAASPADAARRRAGRAHDRALADFVAAHRRAGHPRRHLRYSTWSTFAGVPVSVASASCYTIDPARSSASLIDAGQAFTIVHTYDDGWCTPSSRCGAATRSATSGGTSPGPGRRHARRGPRARLLEDLAVQRRRTLVRLLLMRHGQTTPTSRRARHRRYQAEAAPSAMPRPWRRRGHWTPRTSTRSTSPAGSAPSRTASPTWRRFPGPGRHLEESPRLRDRDGKRHRPRLHLHRRDLARGRSTYPRAGARPRGVPAPLRRRPPDREAGAAGADRQPRRRLRTSISARVPVAGKADHDTTHDAALMVLEGDPVGR